MKTPTQHNADTERGAIARLAVPRRDYASWARETPDEEIRDGQSASYERFIGKKMSDAAIKQYDSTFNSHHGKEIVTRQSQRRFASLLAEAQTEIAA